LMAIIYIIKYIFYLDQENIWLVLYIMCNKYLLFNWFYRNLLTG
jgi:hypothetical protein